MDWNKNVNASTADDIEDLAYPPSGGKVKMVVLGVLLPLLISWFAVEAWIDREAIWFGRGDNMRVHGDAARAMAVCYLSTGAFCHFRWFWGLLNFYRIFVFGLILSIIAGLGGCAAAFYQIL